MDLQNKKLLFLVKRMVSDIGITEVSDDNTSLVLQNLLLQHKEYLRAPKNDLRNAINGTLTTILAPTAENDRGNNGGVIASDENTAITSDASGKTARSKKRKRPQSKGGIPENDKTQDDDDDRLKLRSQGDYSVPRPSTRLSDLAGLDSVLVQVKEMVFYPMQLPHLYAHLGISPPSGLLLHGPSGCGKTTLANAIAGELGLPFFKASGPELIGGTSGESEQRIRDLFDAASAAAPSVLFVDGLDVIAGKRESSQRGMDRRVVAQLFDSIDEIKLMGKVDKRESEEVQQPQEVVRKHVTLIAATNRPDALDPGVRGRFAREVSLPVPDAPARAAILRLVTNSMTLSADVDFMELGKSTPGYVGADLHALASEAGLEAVRRIVRETSSPASGDCNSLDSTSVPDPVERKLCPHHEELFSSVKMEDKAGIGDVEKNIEVMEISETNCSTGASDVADATTCTEDSQPDKSSSPVSPSCFYCSVIDQRNASVSDVCVSMIDFLKASKSIQPSAKREGFAVVPDVTWKDVGALAEVREELLHNVLEPIAHPERFMRLGLDVPAGVLFFGPPGCGKTLLAKALANQSGANFISVKGPELLNMYVGESESRVRQVFSRARASAPCVIFFDELDALCPKRGSGHEGGSGVSERVVNQLLTELDGLETRKDVYIIAATNRLELIDDAMLRPGRLGKLLYVPLPSSGERASILAAISRKVSVADVDFDVIGGDPRAEGYSGADLAALVREAGLAVLSEWRQERELGNDTGAPAAHISARHFEVAFSKVRPSVTPDDRARYDLVHHFIRDEGLGAIEALRAVRNMTEYKDEKSSA